MQFSWPFHLLRIPGEQAHKHLWYKCVCLAVTEGFYCGRQLITWKSLANDDMERLYNKLFPF